MPQVTYGLTGGLSPEQIERMHTEALGLIERVGLRVAHEAIRGVAADHAGVTVSGEVLRFAPELVEAAIAAQVYPDLLRQKDRTVLGGDTAIVSGAYCLNVTDLDTGAVRPATLQDVRDLTRLADSYGMLGSAPVRPLDVAPAELQEIALQKACFECSPTKHVGALDANPRTTPEIAEYAYEMHQAVGAEFALGFWVISPFQANADDLEVMWHFLDREVPLWVATMPIMGATSPIFPVGSYVQSLAELLAGLTLLHVISRGSPIYCSVIDSVRAYPFDMRYGSFVYGSPEDILATLIQVQLNARYGIPVLAKSLLTASKQPDAHAGAEKCAHTLAASLAGARMFTNAGLLSVDEIYSPEQTVIDYEIVQYCRAVCRGYEFSDETLAVPAIEQVGIGGTFLDHDTTLDNYRTAFHEPELFDHRMLQTWQNDGAETIRERAREIARKRIAAHDFALPGDIQRDLDAIYERAKRRYAG